ncbi:hypothetical protein G9A89_016819 [Geosiphon pyriformis]|nr:hypothetical protein G9A89_016819 [Geosiphon pyriformis]
MGFEPRNPGIHGQKYMQKLTEIEYITKMLALILDIVFADIEEKICFYWSKIDLQVMYYSNNVKPFGFTALSGCLIEIDLVDNGLYFGFQGDNFHFSSQLTQMKSLQYTLEDDIVHKAEMLSKDN